MKTYTIIEAINSMKRFKPVELDDHGWLYTHKDEDGDTYVYFGNSKQEMSAELINAKYILEEKRVTITEYEFNEAWRNCYSRDSMKKELGF